MTSQEFLQALFLGEYSLFYKDLRRLKNITGDLYFLNNIAVENKSSLMPVWSLATWQQLIIAYSHCGSLKGIISFIKAIYGLDAQIEVDSSEPNQCIINITSNRQDSYMALALDNSEAYAHDQQNAYAYQALSQVLQNPMQLVQNYCPLGVIINVVLN